jgi:fructokinase
MNEMTKLISIGEVLIDFIPQEKGVPLSEVVNFERVAGGAPANVAACVATLGKPAMLLTKLGKDAFGDYIIKSLKESQVDTTHILRTKQANTGLAFVSLKENGNRDFSFYRNPSSDLLYEASDVPHLFKKGDILHFCSVDLVESPMKYAHKKAIQLAKENGSIISFDPNVRLPLWDHESNCRDTIREFIPFANVVKISDEELEFITGINNEKEAIDSLFIGDVKLVILTLGAKGAKVFTKENQYSFGGYKIKAVDTTGAGDSFIGSFIYQLINQDVQLEQLESIDYTQFIKFSNAVGAIVSTKKGAMTAMPTLSEVYDFQSSHK